MKKERSFLWSVMQQFLSVLSGIPGEGKSEHEVYFLLGSSVSCHMISGPCHMTSVPCHVTCSQSLLTVV